MLMSISESVHIMSNGAKLYFAIDPSGDVTSISNTDTVAFCEAICRPFLRFDAKPSASKPSFCELLQFYEIFHQ